MAEQPRLVCVARITGAHGIKGMVKIFSHAQNPDTLTKLGPLSDAAGRTRFALTRLSQQGKMLLAAIEGVTDRTAAEALAGTDLYLPRDKLPKLEDGKIYYADLIGLAALTPAGQRLGHIVALHNYGAGDLIEIKPDDGDSFLVVFTEDIAQGLDRDAGSITLERPPETR